MMVAAKWKREQGARSHGVGMADAFVGKKSREKLDDREQGPFQT